MKRRGSEHRDERDHDRRHDTRHNAFKGSERCISNIESRLAQFAREVKRIPWTPPRLAFNHATHYTYDV
jgi:hypothetical protein